MHMELTGTELARYHLAGCLIAGAQFSCGDVVFTEACIELVVGDDEGSFTSPLVMQLDELTDFKINARSNTIRIQYPWDLGHAWATKNGFTLDASQQTVIFITAGLDKEDMVHFTTFIVNTLAQAHHERSISHVSARSAVDAASMARGSVMRVDATTAGGVADGDDGRAETGSRSSIASESPRRASFSSSAAAAAANGSLSAISPASETPPSPRESGRNANQPRVILSTPNATLLPTPIATKMVHLPPSSLPDERAPLPTTKKNGKGQPLLPATKADPAHEKSSKRAAVRSREEDEDNMTIGAMIGTKKKHRLEKPQEVVPSGGAYDFSSMLVDDEEGHSPAKEKDARKKASAVIAASPLYFKKRDVAPVTPPMPAKKQAAPAAKKQKSVPAAAAAKVEPTVAGDSSKKAKADAAEAKARVAPSAAAPPPRPPPAAAAPAVAAAAPPPAAAKPLKPTAAPVPAAAGAAFAAADDAIVLSPTFLHRPNAIVMPTPRHGAAFPAGRGVTLNGKDNAREERQQMSDLKSLIDGGLGDDNFESLLKHVAGLAKAKREAKARQEKSRLKIDSTEVARCVSQLLSRFAHESQTRRQQVQQYYSKRYDDTIAGILACKEALALVQDRLTTVTATVDKTMDSLTHIKERMQLDMQRWDAAELMDCTAATASIQQKLLLLHSCESS